MNHRVAFRVAALLWAMWGVLHLAAGLSVLTTFTSEVASVPESVMLTVYRASAFFGIASILGWYLWALAVNDLHAALDWSLGGPQWAPRIGPP